MEVGDHGEAHGRSWVSVSPVGLCRVQQIQIHPGAAAPSNPGCPRLGSLCRVRVQVCSPGEEPFVPETETGDWCPVAGAVLPRCPDSVLQVPLGLWTCLRLGEGHCDVTESCLEGMRAGDVCQVFLSPLQNDGGEADGRTLGATVELQSFSPGRDCWELSEAEKLDWVRTHKQRGGERFRNRDTWGAADSYSRALRLLVPLQDTALEEGPLTQTEFRALKSELLSNLSLCQLKVGQPERARVSAGKATLLEPDSTKAWYRLGRACQLLDELQEARHAFKEVLRLQPDSAAALGALREIAGQEKRADQELGLKLSKMFM